MTWYQKILKKYKTEIISSAVISLACSFIFLIWQYFTGKPFEWTSITPIDQPSVFSRIVYSALTYATIGALLYKIWFYKLLYWISGDWKSFKEAKSLVWGALLFLMFFVIVPWFVDLANNILSIIYNLFALILYLFPAFTLPLLVCALYYFVRKYLVR